MESIGIYELILDDIKENRELPTHKSEDTLKREIIDEIEEIYSKITYLHNRPCLYSNTGYRDKNAILQIEKHPNDGVMGIEHINVYTNPNRKSEYALKDKILTIQGHISYYNDFETFKEYPKKNFYMLIHRGYINQDNQHIYIKQSLEVPFSYTTLVEVLHNFLC